mgnify:CR=1 FL=1
MQRPDREIVERFRGLPVANIDDCMNRTAALRQTIRPINKAPLLGTAFTVKVAEGDNLFFHKAMDMAQPGDIIVVSNDEDQTRSLMGEIMFSYAKYQRKLGGLVLDGPVRDVDALREMDLPVYATGSTPGGPHKEGPGEINVPIACGGISVYPGDIIVADADGIIVIPLKDAPAVLEAARKFHEQDAAKVEAAKNGTSNRAWVKKTLEAKNTEFIDGTYI